MILKSALETFLGLKDSFDFKSFREELKKQRYDLQNTNPESNAYTEGLRYLHVLPDADSWTVKNETEHATNMSFKPSEGLVAHVNKFYDDAQQAAQRINREFCATQPTFAAGGVLVIYLGLRPWKQTQY